VRGTWVGAYRMDDRLAHVPPPGLGEGGISNDHRGGSFT